MLAKKQFRITMKTALESYRDDSFPLRYNRICSSLVLIFVLHLHYFFFFSTKIVSFTISVLRNSGRGRGGGYGTNTWFANVTQPDFKINFIGQISTEKNLIAGLLKKVLFCCQQNENLFVWGKNTKKKKKKMLFEF